MAAKGQDNLGFSVTTSAIDDGTGTSNKLVDSNEENHLYTMDRIVSKYGGRSSDNVRIFLAEMLGTFILMMFGIGSVAQYVLGEGKFGNFLSVNFGWGLGCCMGVYYSAGISGGHINPAVTLAMVVAGRLPLKKLPLYWVAQSIGSFLAAAMCFGIYRDLIIKFENGSEFTMKTAGIFSTYLSHGVSSQTGFGDQVVGTMLLVGCIFAFTDKRNNPPSSGFLPVVVGLLVVAIGICFGINCGYGINPARDLMPRIFTAIAGWGVEPFKVDNYWFWVPVIGQLCGGVLGGFLYIITVEIHHPKETPPVLTRMENTNAF